VSGSTLLARLIEALRCMPGVGPKSAQRIAYHLLRHDRDGARRLAQALTEAMDAIGRCEQCRGFSELKVCELCASDRRDHSLLCVVESPADVLPIEDTGYRGAYFVLMGSLSPLDGIGPRELGLEQLQQRVHDNGVKELILATNPTVQGEATAHYLHELLAGSGVRITRIAQGVPVGGELEYLDSHTLARAFNDRSEW